VGRRERAAPTNQGLFCRGWYPRPRSDITSFQLEYTLVGVKDETMRCFMSALRLKDGEITIYP
jgi:hypothetical protein